MPCVNYISGFYVPDTTYTTKIYKVVSFENKLNKSLKKTSG